MLRYFFLSRKTQEVEVIKCRARPTIIFVAVAVVVVVVVFVAIVRLRLLDAVATHHQRIETNRKCVRVCVRVFVLARGHNDNNNNDDNDITDNRTNERTDGRIDGINKISKTTWNETSKREPTTKLIIRRRFSLLCLVYLCSCLRVRVAGSPFSVN